jgi:RHS repeat-associated protein
MAGLGIYHYGARFYSPKVGRFLSPDTIIPGAGNPQAWNRYSYVLGNPLKYTDPTGHSAACEDGDDCEHDYPAPSSGSSPTNPNNPNDPTEEEDDPNPDSIILPEPADESTPDETLPILTTPGLHPESTPNPVISILGVATLLVLAVPELLISGGIIAIAIYGGPIGWVVDALVLIPLDIAMVNLSIFASQVAKTGSLDHDVLPMFPGIGGDDEH